MELLCLRNAERSRTIPARSWLAIKKMNRCPIDRRPSNGKPIDDLREKQSELCFEEIGKVDIFLDDAIFFDLPPKYVGNIRGVITSPPYLNRYDYSRTYALELCTLFVNDFADLRGIRESLLRSHIESKERDYDEKVETIPVLHEILENLAQKELNNNRIPLMIRSYFTDMGLFFARLTRVLQRGSNVALVVANARFEGELVPVDLLLSELAEQNGLVTEQIWVTRYKGNSSQQMAKYGRVPVRESILHWRKQQS